MSNFCCKIEPNGHGHTYQFKELEGKELEDAMKIIGKDNILRFKPIRLILFLKGLLLKKPKEPIIVIGFLRTIFRRNIL